MFVSSVGRIRPILGTLHLSTTNVMCTRMHNNSSWASERYTRMHKVLRERVNCALGCIAFVLDKRIGYIKLITLALLNELKTRPVRSKEPYQNKPGQLLRTTKPLCPHEAWSDRVCVLNYSGNVLFISDE